MVPWVRRRAVRGLAMSRAARSRARVSRFFRGLALLLAARDADTALEIRHRALTDACRRLLASAQSDEHIRAATDGGDVLNLANGIAVAAAGSADVAGRLLDVLTTGLRAQPLRDRTVPL
ncbi:SbtR family transcriptional regulator [Streptosporangium sandarakinum]|uniref:SbtR family transcriptional regulator n=1 Tax=Streptosporangium sandarakinum TaxID=1260955 RepID=UPI00369C1767